MKKDTINERKLLGKVALKPKDTINNKILVRGEISAVENKNPLYFRWKSNR